MVITPPAPPKSPSSRSLSVSPCPLSTLPSPSLINAEGINDPVTAVVSPTSKRGRRRPRKNPDPVKRTRKGQKAPEPEPDPVTLDPSLNNEDDEGTEINNNTSNNVNAEGINNPASLPIAAVVSPPTKRGRGRPPKNQQADAPQQGTRKKADAPQ